MRRGLRTAFLATVLFVAALPCRGAETGPPLPRYTIETARARLQYLKEEEGRIEDWVEENAGKEVDVRFPGPAGPSRRAQESDPAYKAWKMRARMALSEVKGRLRRERGEWIRKERENLLAAGIREMLPARLGPYDPDRGEYPLLLGFGWPAGLSIRFHVPESFRRIFELRFIGKIPAWFRMNERGDPFLVSLGRFWKETDPVRPRVEVLPQGPKVAWQGSHDSWVTSVAFRPDGSQVLSAGADGTLRAWDAVTGNRVFQLDNVELALSVAYAPDGKTFATGGADSALRVRAAGDGRLLWSVPADGRILSVAYSPDGRHVAAGDGGGKVRVWNASSGKESAVSDLASPIWSVAFTAGGTAIVAGVEGNAVVFLNLLYDRRTWRKEFDWPVFSVATGGEGGLIAVGGGGNRVVVLREKDASVAWSADMGGETRTLRFSPSGKALAGGGSGYAVNLFAADTGRRRWSSEIGSPVRSIDFGPDGTKIAVGSSDFSVRLFEVADEERVVAAYWSPGRIYLEPGVERSLFRPIEGT